MILRNELAAQDEGGNAMADVPSIDVAELIGKQLEASGCLVVLAVFKADVSS